MNKRQARSTTRILSVGLVLALLLLVGGLASAQPRSVTSFFVEEAKLTASDGAAGDHFGGRVSISGDTVVVGAGWDDDMGVNSGSAYVFERDEGGPGTWGQVAKLTASDGDQEDEFGISVSISGDTVVIGAYLDDPDGSAYVFEEPETGWPESMTETAKLTASESTEVFGYSVAMSGDLVIVGAPGDDANGENSGSAYLFERDEGGADNWGQVAKLTASDGADHDVFGDSVSISGDTLIVGAPNVDDSSGAAYLFERPEAGWDDTTETAKLTGSDGAAYDGFGDSVSISGDTVVIGSDESTYLFEKPVTGWDDTTETAKLTASDGAAYDGFGGSVSISGDTVVVGAPQADNIAPYSGSAYLFEKPESGWPATMTETNKLTASDGAFLDYFGHVSISGGTIVVGAHRDDDNGDESGSAYVFLRFESVAWVYLPLVLRSAP